MKGDKTGRKNKNGLPVYERRKRYRRNERKENRERAGREKGRKGVVVVRGPLRSQLRYRELSDQSREHSLIIG